MRAVKINFTHFFFLVLVLAIGFSCKSPNPYMNELPLIGVIEDNSYLISWDGKPINDQHYVDISRHIEGYWSARKKIGNDTLSGYVDIQGKEYAFKYQNTFNFSEGFAVVQLTNGKYCHIDTSFNIISKQPYDFVYHFNEGFAPVFIDGKWTFIDIHNNLLTEPIFDDVFQFKNGFARVTSKGRYAYINRKGEQICDFRFTNWRPFDEHGLAFVVDEEIGQIVIDTMCNNVFEDKDFKIDDVYFDKLGTTTVIRKEEEKYKRGRINRKGEIVVPIKFYLVEPFSTIPFSNAAYKYYRNNLLVDTARNIIKETEFNEIGIFCPYGHSVVRRQEDYGKNFIDETIGRSGMIDTTGQLRISVNYYSLHHFYMSEDRLDLTNDSFIYKQCYFHATKEKGGLKGVLNENEEIIVPFKYNKTLYVGDGLYFVERNGTKAVFNTSTNKEDKIYRFEYERRVWTTRNPYLFICKDTRTDKKGIKDSNYTKWIIPPKFDDIVTSNKRSNLFTLKPK